MGKEERPDNDKTRGQSRHDLRQKATQVLKRKQGYEIGKMIYNKSILESDQIGKCISFNMKCVVFAILKPPHDKERGRLSNFRIYIMMKRLLVALMLVATLPLHRCMLMN